MLTKIMKKLTTLLLSFFSLAILFDYLILNNMLNENNLLITILAFTVNFMTSLIVLFNAINSMKCWTSSNNTKHFVQFILWTMATLIVEYFITIPQISFAIYLANGILAIYVLTLVHQYFKQGDQK